MAYDEKLAQRIRKFTSGMTEREMFGGIAFMHDGKMVCGVLGEWLVARVGPDVPSKPNTRPMDFTGRPMKGYFYVEPAGVKTDAALQGWIELALKFVRTLPTKKKSGRKRP